MPSGNVEMHCCDEGLGMLKLTQRPGLPMEMEPAEIEPVVVRMLALDLDAAFVTLEAAETDAVRVARMALDDVERFSGLVTNARAVKKIQTRARALEAAIGSFPS